MRHFNEINVKQLRSKRYDLLLLAIIISAGIFGAVFAGYSVNNRNKRFLLQRAQTIAVSLPIDQVNKLEGKESDLNSAHYVRIKDTLTRVRKANDDVQFAYLAGRDKDNIFFFVDSEPPDSEDYSPPGQKYPEASKEFKDVFTNKQSLIEGPYRDRWGTWISALVPIVDQHTGKVVAVAGIDSSATSNYVQVGMYSLVPLILAAVPCLELIRQRKAKRREREIIELKNHFVSIASHELRSPLSGIMWAIQSMLRKSKGLTDEQQSLLTDMYVGAEATLGTVNEILDLSIFERGRAKTAVQQEPLNLTSVMSQVFKSLKLGADEKNIILHFSKNWPKEARIIGDANALKRAFTNVISNSIKYSPETSQITINYQHQGNMHVVSVEDAGIGIPNDEIDKVMQGYYRARNASKIQSHGTGLGVWVTRLVVEQHKGRFWIQSQENVGTVVFMALPEYKGPMIIPEKPEKG